MVSKKKPTGLLKDVRLCFTNMFNNKLKGIALASSLFFLVSCATPIIGKHWGGSVYKQLKAPKKTYAILVSGAFPDVNKTDMVLQDKAVEVYDQLKDLGLSDDDIYFLATRRDSEKMENSDDLFTYRKFHNVCNDLSTKITEEDALLFIYIGHGNTGGIDIPESYHLLKNIDEETEPEELDNNFYVFHLEAEVDRLKASYKIMIIDACKSGHGAKMLGKKNNIGISSSCKDQNSWIFSRFVPYLMKALNSEEKADKDENGKVSLEEAVDYASKKDPWSKKSFGLGFFFPEPQMYYDEVDPSQVFLKE